MEKNSNLPDGLTPCEAVGEQLSAYLDGELTAEETAAVEAHLRDCPDCARLCAALRILRVDLAAAQLDPPSALHGRVMAAVRRENRLRRLRRFTAAATVGVAAMFCFVVIGGAILRGGVGADMAADVANPGMAKMLEADGMAETYGYSLMDEGGAMTGAVIDTTIVAELTIAGTGLESDTPGEPAPNSLAAAAETSAPVGADLLPSAAPSNQSPDTTVAPAAPAAPVMSIFLAESRRDISRLTADDTIRSMSTGQSTATVESAARKPLYTDVRDGRLAEEQLGTLCVIEQGEGTRLTYAVFDLVTGERLSLGDFLGGDSLPTLFVTLGATADTAYRPTADGLILLLPEGETCIRWSECPELQAAVARFEMTRQPLCGA